MDTVKFFTTVEKTQKKKAAFLLLRHGSDWKGFLSKTEITEQRERTKDHTDVEVAEGTCWLRNCQMLWLTACSGGVGLLHPIGKPHPGDHLG
jgi:hypothetical protein